MHHKGIDRFYWQFVLKLTKSESYIESLLPVACAMADLAGNLAARMPPIVLQLHILTSTNIDQHGT
jgi:hypothetical protein